MLKVMVCLHTKGGVACAAAIVDCLFASSIFWPDEAEREEIDEAFNNLNDFPNCIGIVDGALFPLWSKPQREDFADFFGRQMGCSLTCLIANDHKRRVRYFHLGWPGSVHDERLMANCTLQKDPSKFFHPGQCLLGNSAFSNKPWLVPAFKKTTDNGLNQIQ